MTPRGDTVDFLFQVCSSKVSLLQADLIMLRGTGFVLIQTTIIKCRTAQKVHPGSTNFNINITYCCFSFILTLFLPPLFLFPNLLLTDLNYFFPTDLCFAASLSQFFISVTISYVVSDSVQVIADVVTLSLLAYDKLPS